MKIQPQKHMLHSTDGANGRVSSEGIVLKKKCTSSCMYVKLLSMYGYHSMVHTMVQQHHQTAEC